MGISAHRHYVGELLSPAPFGPAADRAGAAVRPAINATPFTRSAGGSVDARTTEMRSASSSAPAGPRSPPSRRDFRQVAGTGASPGSVVKRSPSSLAWHRVVHPPREGPHLHSSRRSPRTTPCSGSVPMQLDTRASKPCGCSRRQGYEACSLPEGNPTAITVRHEPLARWAHPTRLMRRQPAARAGLTLSTDREDLLATARPESGHDKPAGQSLDCMTVQGLPLGCG